MALSIWKLGPVAALLLLLAACGGPEKRSGIQGSLGATPATTSLDFEPSEAVVVDGTVVLSAGSCSVVLRDPYSTAVWTQTYQGPGTFTVGPYSIRASVEGTWTLEVSGSDGTYDVSLSSGW